MLKLIGYWGGGTFGGDDWIMPQDLVDPEWRSESHDALVRYLQSGKVALEYMGDSICRICGQPNGATEVTDGVWLWPEGLAHYVEAHNVRLPEAFASHASENGFQIPPGLEDKNVDDAKKLQYDVSYWQNWCRANRRR